MIHLQVVPSVAGVTILVLVLWGARLRGGLTRDPKWQLVEATSWAALAYCGLDFALGVGMDAIPVGVAWATRLQFFAVGIWCFFAVPQEAGTHWKPRTSSRWAYAAVLSAFLVAALVPGALVGEGVRVF